MGCSPAVHRFANLTVFLQSDVPGACSGWNPLTVSSRRFALPDLPGVGLGMKQRTLVPSVFKAVRTVASRDRLAMMVGTGSHPGGSQSGGVGSPPAPSSPGGRSGSGSATPIYGVSEPADLTERMFSFLRVQVDVSFERHHGLLVEHGLSSCKNILDVGTSNGYFCSRMADQHPRIHFTGMDVVPDMIDRARATGVAAGISNIEWMHGDITDPNALGDRRFDGMLMRLVACHLEDARVALEIAYSVLNPGGHLWLFDLDMDCMTCSPPHRGFDIYKAGVERALAAKGVDVRLAKRLPNMLTAAGFQDVVSVSQPLTNSDMGRYGYKRFVIEGSRMFDMLAPGTFGEGDLDSIALFAEAVENDRNFLATNNDVFLAAVKPK